MQCSRTTARTTFTAFRSATTALPRSAQRPSYPHHQHRDLHSGCTVKGEGMKLLTHNMMKSHVKGISNGYPLIIRVAEQAEEEMEFNPDFIIRMLPRIEYEVLKGALVQVGKGEAVPARMPENPAEDEEFLRALHHVLLEVQIVEGELECPGSGTKFPIANGIPNMLLPEV